MLGGWSPRAGDDQIAWALPKAINGPGAIEIDVSNWRPDAQVGSVEKSNFFGIYGAAHGNQVTANEEGQSYAYFRTGSKYTPDRIKVTSASAGQATRIERIVQGIAPWSGEHTFRIEWDDEEVRFLVDGALIKALPFGSQAAFSLRHVFLARDNNAKGGGGVAFAGPVYRNLRVYDFGAKP